MKKSLAIFVVFYALCQSVLAQTLSVTSPNSGDLLGRTNQVKFLGDNIQSQIRVTVVLTKSDDAAISFTNEQLFDPDSNKKVTGSIDLNIDDASPQGSYNLKIQWTHGGIRQADIVIGTLTVDTKVPKFKNVIPASNSFVSDNVVIQGELEEPNINQWRVKINDKDIPNNSGSTANISVLWQTKDAQGNPIVENDGPYTISIKVDDKAKNSATRSLSITLDRVPPSSSIKSPTGTNYRPTAIIPVVINIDDQYDNSVIKEGVDVELRSLDGQFLQKVARRSARAQGSTLQWIGRIKNSVKLPTQFKIVVTAVDRAGNKAQLQEITVTIAGR